MQPSEELTMGSLSQMASAMVKSFQKLDLAARHDIRKKIYNKVTAQPYRRATRHTRLEPTGMPLFLDRSYGLQ